MVTTPVSLVPPLLGRATESCLSRNEWICADYFTGPRLELVWQALRQHVGIVLASVLLGLAIAFPLALLGRRYPMVESFVLGATTAIYTIPSLALFSLLVPLTGLGVGTVVIGLALYSLTVLVRGMIDGLQAVPADVRESAIGMGYERRRLLLRVELPLATPAIMASLRVATVSTVALTTVGQILDYGGLGTLLIQANDDEFKAQVLLTSVLCVALAITLDLLIVVLQRRLTPWTRAVLR